MSYYLLDKSFNDNKEISLKKTYVIKQKAILPKKQIRIAIIDTGLNLINESDINLCSDYKRIDFTTDQDNVDRLGHGTNISYIIADRLKGLDYCITVIKAFSKSREDASVIIYSLSMAYNFITDNNYDIVNLSFGGPDKIPFEEESILTLLEKNVKIFAAAGNEHMELTDNNCNYFPACYSKQIHTIGNITSKSSNYGEYVREWEDGTAIYGGGYKMTGTSQATAIATSKYVRKLLK